MFFLCGCRDFFDPSGNNESELTFLVVCGFVVCAAFHCSFGLLGWLPGHEVIGHAQKLCVNIDDKLGDDEFTLSILRRAAEQITSNVESRPYHRLFNITCHNVCKPEPSDNNPLKIKPEQYFTRLDQDACICVRVVVPAPMVTVPPVTAPTMTAPPNGVPSATTLPSNIAAPSASVSQISIPLNTTQSKTIEHAVREWFKKSDELQMYATNTKSYSTTYTHTHTR